ncbi:hypothetical protein [Demequina subtropica]|uniref:hypothetical protein n=1 Tax=Demequina subtropica TaxID=1638989 RepID=UPI0012E02255|nr:hypothetical protein [Demequina subtropica]
MKTAMLAGKDVVLRVGWRTRLAQLYLGRDPVVPLSQVEWVASVGRLHRIDATAFVEFSVMGSLSVAQTWSYSDVRAKSSHGRGRAYVRVRFRKPVYVVKVRSGGKWALLLFSARNGDELMAAILAANPRVRRRQARELINPRLHP